MTVAGTGYDEEALAFELRGWEWPGTPEPGSVVQSLDRLREKLRKHGVEITFAEQAAEALRIERWHATYNAALTGMFAGAMSVPGSSTRITVVDAWAADCADLRHGPLVKP